MPKVILKYSLPEEQDDFTLASKGKDFWACLWDLDQECRNYLKHGYKFKTPAEVLEWVRKFISESVELECVQ